MAKTAKRKPRVVSTLPGFIASPEYHATLNGIVGKAIEEKVGGIVEATIVETLTQRPLVRSWNGSDTPTTKSFLAAQEDMSQNLRKVVVGLDENTEITKKHTELLQGKEDWRNFKKSVFTVGKSADKVFKLRKRWKVLIAVVSGVTVLIASPSLHEVLNWIKSFFI